MARSLLGVPGTVVGLALLLLLTGCYGAYQVKADHPTGAGSLTPTVEDKDVGLVGLTAGLDIKTYRVIAVSLFPVTDLTIKDDGDRRLAASNLIETAWQPGAEKALRLDGRITRLGEGSQTARAFAGLYGAGKARAQSDMTFTDAQTGQPVMVTADRRVAQMGFFEGDSKDHLKESFDDMARDLARFLVRLSRGEAPKKD